MHSGPRLCGAVRIKRSSRPSARIASIYRDWCSVACDETQEDVPDYWVDDLEVWPIYLGQLVSDEQLSDDPEEALSEALRIVMNGQREQTVRALQKAYGGDVEDLFVALWRSVRGFTEPDPDDDDYVEEDYAAILNTPTEASLAGYEWSERGARTCALDILRSA
jgi:hypothetical protein